jgi:hypothetical protein
MREAIASTALSHPESCGCLTCRAASGNEDAFAEVLAELCDGEHDGEKAAEAQSDVVEAIGATA